MLEFTDHYKNLTDPTAPGQAKRDAREIADWFTSDACVGNDGVVRWAESQEIPSVPVLAFWQRLGKPFQFELSLKRLQIEGSMQISRVDMTSLRDMVAQGLAHIQSASK